MTAIERVIRGFRRIARRRGWHIPHVAFGSCAQATEEFIEYARSQGIPAYEVQLSGYRGDPTMCRSICDSRWLRLPPESWHHYVVRVGAAYVDWTARQFDIHAAFPARISPRQWRKRWVIHPETRVARRLCLKASRS